MTNITFMFDRYFKDKPKAWKDASEVILAFATAFLFYQVLIWTTGTPMPIVSVVSNSMYHSSDFNSWWNTGGQFYENIGIERGAFESYPMHNGFYMGDIVFSVKEDPKVGDIIIYTTGRSYTIIHRVIDVTEEGYVTKGDNNAVPDPYIVRESQVVGKAMFSMPLLGYPRLILYAVGV